MNIDRIKAIEAAEAAYHQEKAREANFRTYLCAHLGPEIGNQEAEAICSSNNPRELYDGQLKLVLHFAAGIPPGFQMSEEQIDVALEAVLAPELS